MSYTKALKRLQTIRAHVAPNLVEETKEGDSSSHSDSMLRNVSNKKASIWSGFHQKPIKDRINLLKRLYPTLDGDIFLKGSLTPAQADMMVENCVGKIELPLGLGLNFLINGKEYVVPMALEEPSVIAAASSVAKFVSERGGGFKVHTTAPVMASQIVFIGVNYSNAKYLVDMNSQKIVDFCNSHCRVMVSYGGGCRGVRTKKIYELQTEDESRDVMVVELLIDVQESMGMNLCNTLAERCSEFIRNIIGEGKIGLRIATNLCVERMATSFFKIPVDKLAWKDLNGKEVAQGIIRAYEFAVHDIKRTATHNKGIMNGVDAVALALGQDWRGIEAAAHTYATLDGGYRPLTKYRIAKDTSGREFLLGELELPIACASKGGVLGTNPAYNATHLVAGQPTGRQIAGILVSVGLAQNFAAMRALAVEGIQKGHMTLHAKNIAVSAGVPPNLIDEVVAFMSSKGTFDVGTVEDYMKAHKIYSVTKKGNISESSKKTFSTCFVKIDHPDLAETIILNLIIETPEDQKPIHLSITQDPEDKKAFGKIFGDHSYDWILKILLLSNQLTEVTELPGYQKTHQASLCYRLKLITILINRVVTAILRNYKEEGIEIIESVYSVCKGSNVEYKIPSSHFFLHNLLTELIATYRYYIDENIDNKFLREALIEDIMISLFGLKESYKYLYGITGLTKENYSIFIGHSSKRINLTQVLLIDILACDQSRITSEYIKHIVALGQVIELKAVSIRDVHKAELNDNSNYNCYYNWLKIHGKDAQRMNEKNKVEFLKSVDELNAGKISVDTSKIMNQIKFNLLLLNV